MLFLRFADGLLFGLLRLEDDGKEREEGRRGNDGSIDHTTTCTFVHTTTIQYHHFANPAPFPSSKNNADQQVRIVSPLGQTETRMTLSRSPIGSSKSV